MDIRKTLAAQAYSQSRLAVAPDLATDSAEAGLAGFVESFAQTLHKGEETARAAMVGKADPHALIEALASSQSAVETVVTLRDRVVEAYQEILRMPV